MRTRITPLITVAIIVILFAGCSSGGRLPESQRLVGPSRINMRSGNTYMGIQEFDNALESYKKVVEENPENIEALKNISDIYFFYAEEHPERAREYYTKSHYYNSRVIAAWEEIKDLGRFPALRERVEDAELKMMAAWARLFNRGQELFGQNEIEKALESFYELAELAPDSTNTYIMIASIYQTKDDNEMAVEYFERIAQQDNKDTISRTNLAAFHFNEQNFEEAIRWYGELADLEPENPDHHYMQGLVYMNKEEMANALSAFETAYDIDNSFIDAAVNAGLLAYQLDETDKAIRFYKAAHELEPEDSEWLVYLLHSLNKAEDYEQMLTYGMRLYELDNTNVDAISFIVIAATQQNEVEIQQEFLQKLQEMEN